MALRKFFHDNFEMFGNAVAYTLAFTCFGFILYKTHEQNQARRALEAALKENSVEHTTSSDTLQHDTAVEKSNTGYYTPVQHTP